MKQRNVKRKIKKVKLHLLAALILAGCLSLFSPAVMAEKHILGFSHNKKYNGIVQSPFPGFQMINYSGSHDSVLINGYKHYYIHDDGTQELLFCIMPFALVADEFESMIPLETAMGMTYKLNRDAADVSASIKELSYFGYASIPPAVRTEEDYFATQFAIWEEIGFTVQPEGGNDFSWYRTAAEKIRSRRASWSLDPSFCAETHEAVSGDSISLEDTNGVLESFMHAAGYQAGQESQIEPGVSVIWDGANTLTFRISPDYTGEIAADFSCGSEWKAPEAFWFGNRQAKMSALEFMPPKSFQVRLHAALPTGKLRILKTAEQIQSFIPTAVKGHTVYEANYQELPLEGAEFELRSAELILRRGEALQAGTTVASGVTDEDGILCFEDIPCGQYLLYETSVPQGYFPLPEPLAVKIVRQTDEEEVQELRISNERKKYSLKFRKTFAEGSHYTDEELLRETCFALQTIDELECKDELLPAGSFVSLASLAEGAGANPVPGVNPADSGDKSWSVGISVPLPALYRLTELSTHPDYQPCSSYSLDLSRTEQTVLQEDGSFAFDFAVMLVNERTPLPPTREAQTESQETTVNTEPPATQAESRESTANTDPPAETELYTDPPDFFVPLVQAPAAVPLQRREYTAAGTEAGEVVMLPRTGEDQTIVLGLAALLVSFSLLLLRKRWL